MEHSISNNWVTIDSSDIMARLMYLNFIRDQLLDDDLADFEDSDDGMELAALIKVAMEGIKCAGWNDSTILINEEYFTEYLYDLTDGRTGFGDQDSRVEDERDNYIALDFAGTTYFVHK
jgi:hypothetical protein